MPFSFILGIVGRRSLAEPDSKLPQRMGQSPFVENGSCHGRRRARKFWSCAGERIIEQPFFKCFGIRVFGNGPRQQIALDRQSDRIGCLVAFAFAPAPF